jgi:hypothetical protein
MQLHSQSTILLVLKPDSITGGPSGALRMSHTPAPLLLLLAKQSLMAAAARQRPSRR